MGSESVPPFVEHHQAAPRVPTTTWAGAAYAAAVVVVALYLLVASQAIGMMNQGDFRRTVGFMLTEPVSAISVNTVFPVGLEWHYRDSMGGPTFARGTSSLMFWLLGALQRLVSDTYHLLVAASMLKLLLLFIAERSARAAAVVLQHGYRARFVWFCGFCLVFFSAHNVAVLASFYAESAFQVGLAAMVLALLLEGQDEKRRRWLLAAAAGLGGGAKVQFFYVPMLLWLLIAAADYRANLRLDRRLLAALLVAQLVAFGPLAKGEFRAVNSYHATYLGAYLVMTPSEQSLAGLTAEQRRCVGVDAWGNRISAADTTAVASGDSRCFRDIAADVGLMSVARAYRAVPAIAYRLWVATEPHFTVKYFHLSKSLPYLIDMTVRPQTGASAPLSALTEWRERLVPRPVWLLIVIMGLVIPLFACRVGPPPLRVTSVFLSLFALSQVVVAIFGEGVRDLSKHLSAAQFAVDLLVVMLATQVVLTLRRYWRSGQTVRWAASS